jgi:hypothetical protein
MATNSFSHQYERAREHSDEHYAALEVGMRKLVAQRYRIVLVLQEKRVARAGDQHASHDQVQLHGRKRFH